MTMNGTLRSQEWGEVEQALSQLELRAQHGDVTSRQVGHAVRQLTALAAWAWPETAPGGFALALRLLDLASALHENAETTPPAAWQLAELALTRLSQALADGPGVAADVAPRLVELWQGHRLISRELLEELVTESADVALLHALAEQLVNALHADVSLRGARPGVMAPPRARDVALFAARVQAALGQLDASLAELSRVNEADPIVLEASADLYAEGGHFAEAIDRLRRALLVTDEPLHIREQLYELYLESGQRELAIQEMLGLLQASGDPLYWNILVHELSEHAPERLESLRRELAVTAPGLHVEILIHEGDVAAVAAAARGKNFSAAELWRVGDYLSTRRPAAAMTLYLRAIALQGAAARSRQECAELGQRLDRVVPFFRKHESDTRLRKAFRDVLARHRRNIPLERELERVVTSLAA